MRKDEAIEYFGSIAELARSIHQTRRSVELWGEMIPVCRREKVRDAMRRRAEELEKQALTLRGAADA